MGQQQLLLLVLGIVIVGIAVVAGIQAFSEGKDKAEQDAAISDAMRIISDTQAWMLKPAAFGGGSGAESPNDKVTFAALGYKVTAGQAYATVNGCFELTGHGAKSATLVIYRLNDTTPETPGGVSSCGGAEIATVDITGATTEDISWTYAEEES